jgi:internalin A
MASRTRLSGCLGILAAALAAAVALADDKVSVRSVEQVVAALADQVASIESLDCRYSIQFGDSATPKRCRYARSGKMWHETELSVDQNQVKERTLCCDGNLTFNFTVTHLQPGGDKWSSVQIQDPREPGSLKPDELLGERLSNVSRSAVDVLKLPGVKKSEETLPDGTMGIRLSAFSVPRAIPGPKQLTFDVAVTLDPKHSLLPREIVITQPKEDVRWRGWEQRWKILEYRQFLDERAKRRRWFPISGVLTQGSTGSPTIKMTVQEVRINATLPIELFRPTIPGDATIFHGDVVIQGGRIRVAAPASPATSSEKSAVEAIRAGKTIAGADPRLATVIRKIDELRGQLEFDAAGRLVGVDLAGDRVSIGDADIPFLTALPNLRRLRLSGSGITGTGVKQIATIRGLTELSLLDAQIDNDGLGRLAGLSSLTVLSIQRSALVSDAGLEHLKRLPKLTNLGLLDLSITDAGLARLAGLTQLRLLDLRGSAQITNGGLAQLRRLKTLKVLRLRGYSIGDETLAIVKDFPALTGLTVEESAITNPGLAHLSRMPLEEISLFRCYSVSDEGLEHFKGLANLRQLSLRDMPITGAGLVHLRDKQKLAVLRLNETGVDDAALKHLAGLKSLARLELRQTRITDAAVEPLAKLKSLKVLNVSQTGLTEDALRRLKAALPGCDIQQ